MRLLLPAIILLFTCTVFAQNTETGSLKRLLDTAGQNSNRVRILEGLSFAYLSSYPDSALLFANEGLELARTINDTKGLSLCTTALGNVYFQVGDNVRALELYLEGMKIEESLPAHTGLPVSYFNIAGVYTEQQDYEHALYYLFKAKQEDERLKDSAAILFDYYSLGSNYLRMGKNDSALNYIKESHRLAIKLDDRNMLGAILNTYGEAYAALNQFDTAAAWYHASFPYAIAVNDNTVVAADYFGLAKIFKEKKKLDSSIYNARKALQIAQAAPFMKQVLEMSTFLVSAFKEQKKFDSAFFYQELSIATKDSLFNSEQIKKVQNLKLQEQQRQQSIAAERLQLRNKIKLYAVLGIAAGFLIIAFLLWRNNRQKHKDFNLLQEEKHKTEQAYRQLKDTQAQLIHAEKMASLGELTAGIAHEIQNPLNFVNNFAEVNKDLLAEMKGEFVKGNLEEVKLIADDIEQNELRIIHHGHRAAAIVKGMMQHSKNSKGQKELTDINELADEYLGIAYHGFIAKNNFPGIVTSTDFDQSIPALNIIPEDIAKVLLNLYNNALYAVTEKKTLRQAEDSAIYEPSISVTTKKSNGKAEIKITDNGDGIPEHIVDKIFQPFYTTKPTGQGTGLGLSLSYDIIKAHDGEIKVESVPGEHTSFIIYLPFTIQ